MKTLSFWTAVIAAAVLQAPTAAHANEVGWYYVVAPCQPNAGIFDAYSECEADPYATFEALEAIPSCRGREFVNGRVEHWRDEGVAGVHAIPQVAFDAQFDAWLFGDDPIMPAFPCPPPPGGGGD